MKISLIYSMVFLGLISCVQNQKVIRKPFEINHKVTCSDLLNQGYQWMPEQDVILFGKKSGDTLDYYQISDKVVSEDYQEENDIEYIEVELDTIVSGKSNDLQLLEERDEIKDTISIFHRVKFHSLNPSIAYKPCKNTVLIWRNFVLHIQAKDTLNYFKNIEQDNLKIIKPNIKVDYCVSRARVINLVTKDTFRCSVYKEDGKYFFSSTIAYNKY